MRMQPVVRFGLAALLALASAPPAWSQDAPDAPRPRPADEQDAAEFAHPRRGAPGRAPLARLFRASEPPRLGVMVDETPDGVLVREVTPDGLAAQAGVQVDDLLLSLDGERLQRADDIRRVLADAAPGSALELTVVRAGKGLEKLSVTVPEPPAPDAPDRDLADGHKGGFLGVELGEPADGGGVVVTGVVDETAAWFAGLDEGDVLLSIDDTELTGPEDVVGAVSSKEPGHLVTLAWERQGDRREASIRLGHRPHPFGQMFPVDPGSGQMPRFRGQGRLLLPQWDAGGAPDVRGLDDLHSFFGGQGGQAPFDFGGLDFQGYGAGLHEGIREWAERLTEQLGQDLDLDLQGAESLRIRIEDGRVTIEQDGETQTFDLPAEEAEEIALQLPGLSGTLRLPPAAHGLLLAPDRTVLQVPLGLRLHRTDGAPPITIRRKACDAPCEGNQGTTTEADVL